MSTPDNREETLFHAALELPPAERALYLAQECAGDQLLRERVAALIKAHDHASGILEQGVDGGIT